MLKSPSLNLFWIVILSSEASAAGLSNVTRPWSGASTSLYYLAYMKDIQSRCGCESECDETYRNTSHYSATMDYEDLSI
jgi:hypothetical protein